MIVHFFHEGLEETLQAFEANDHQRLSFGKTRTRLKDLIEEVAQAEQKEKGSLLFEL